QSRSHTVRDRHSDQRAAGSPERGGRSMSGSIRRLLPCLAAASLCSLLGAQDARAEGRVVLVTIERVKALSDFDPGVCAPIVGCVGRTDADFYAIVNINGREENNKDSNISDQDDISPNWQFSRPVDAALGSVQVSIGINDADGFLRGDDDVADINGA